ncbi:hypothetical protein [uncultured Pontibacter sp.]|uniref:hypothetical protein n=1 Tax=uncultured Pontibacter sp. TaxID=453356 RepID=UPI00262C623A|nr:hypothetical protein [uncultured Pontibacter sp.]
MENTTEGHFFLNLWNRAPGKGSKFMQLTAKFKGVDSLGYQHGKSYQLSVALMPFPPRVIIKRLSGGGLCPYESLNAFYENWYLLSTGDAKPQIDLISIDEAFRLRSNDVSDKLIKQLKEAQEAIVKHILTHMLRREPEESDYRRVKILLKDSSMERDVFFDEIHIGSMMFVNDGTTHTSDMAFANCTRIIFQPNRNYR